MIMGEKLPAMLREKNYLSQMGKNDHKLPTMVRKNIHISQMGENDHKLPAMLREKNLPDSNG